MCCIRALVRADLPMRDKHSTCCEPPSGAIGRSANLFMVNMEKADFRDGDLAQANFQGANLSGVDLKGARLLDARMGGAIFKKTRLQGADLLGCTGLSRGQLDAAEIDDQTRLPEHLLKD